MAKRKSSRSSRLPALAPEQFERSIMVVRGHKVLIDEHLAAFYGVETKRLVEAVKRNFERFPDDFMIQLSVEEWDGLRSQFATSSLRTQFVTSKFRGHGGRRYAPYAFTEQGVAMLSSVLRSPRAIDVNIQIMRAFVRLRHLLSLHKELAERLGKLEKQMIERDHGVDQQFRQVFALLEKLFAPPTTARKPIGFHAGGAASGRQSGRLR